jgi:hypothetical protein
MPPAELNQHPLAPLGNRTGNLIFRDAPYFPDYPSPREHKDRFNTVRTPRD